VNLREAEPQVPLFFISISAGVFFELVVLRKGPVEIILSAVYEKRAVADQSIIKGNSPLARPRPLSALAAA